nr:hypothetical protein Itr_chr06CG04510 [Ipomoea trifida]
MSKSLPLSPTAFHFQKKKKVDRHVISNEDMDTQSGQRGNEFKVELHIRRHVNIITGKMDRNVDVMKRQGKRWPVDQSGKCRYKPN